MRITLVVMSFLISLSTLAASYPDYSSVTSIIDNSTSSLYQLKILSDGSLNDNSILRDGQGSTNTALVDSNHALLVNLYNGLTAVDSQFYYYVTNGASTAMNVNGSTTPVNFFYTNISTTQDMYITDISIVGNDAGISYGKFFGRNLLTNGMQYQIKNDALVSPITLFNFKQNEELIGVSSSYKLDASMGNPQNASFFLSYSQPIKLAKNNNEYVKFIVRDNISAMAYLRVMIKGYLK